MEYISAEKVMDRITRHPLLEDMPYEIVIDYIEDFMRKMGVPNSFLDKTAIIHIDEYRGQLPCDFYAVTQVRDRCGNYYKGTTDSFHMSPLKEKDRDTGYTYKLQGSMIFTSVKHTDLEIVYTALPVDSEGIPMIPDNAAYINALTLYVKVQKFTELFDCGKLNPQVLQHAERDYAFALGNARTNLIMPTMDQMESITQMWNSLIRRKNHKTGFVTE